MWERIACREQSSSNPAVQQIGYEKWKIKLKKYYCMQSSSLGNTWIWQHLRPSQSHARAAADCRKRIVWLDLDVRLVPLTYRRLSLARLPRTHLTSSACEFGGIAIAHPKHSQGRRASYSSHGRRTDSGKLTAALRSWTSQFKGSSN